MINSNKGSYTGNSDRLLILCLVLAVKGSACNVGTKLVLICQNVWRERDSVVFQQFFFAILEKYVNSSPNEQDLSQTGLSQRL